MGISAIADHQRYAFFRQRDCTRQLWRTGPIRQLHAAASAVAAAMKNRIVASRIFRQGSTQQGP
jgi:hypothetical protein